MRLIACLVLFAALPLGAGALTTAERNELCAMIGELAEVTMRARQGGVPMSQLMGILGNSDAPQEVASLVNSMVVMAYEQPRYRTAAVQADTVSDFRDRFEVMCFQTLAPD